MKAITDILMDLEGKCRMDINAPASEKKMLELMTAFPSQTEAIEALYKITDGVEIDVPGTVLYSVEKILELNKGKESAEALEIGAMNFGDAIVVTNQKAILQIEHETGETFLDWDSLEAFLLDEMDALG